MTERSNVIKFPTPERFQTLTWVTLSHLDGREWRSGGFYCPTEAWNWVVESVALEYGADPEDLDCVEDFGGDVICYDGFPLYRVTVSKC